MSRGFSLIEVLVSAGLLFLVILLGINPLLRSRLASHQTDRRFQALSVGYQLLEEFRLQPNPVDQQGRRAEVSYRLTVNQVGDGNELVLILEWRERNQAKSLTLTTEIGEPL